MKRPYVCLALVFGACSLELDPPKAVIHARFDPDAKVIPMPTDILRDKVTGHLAIPIDDTNTPAEKTLFTAMNQLDGWSTAMAATVSFDGPIDRATITPDNLQVWHWRTTPERVTDVRFEIAADNLSITIDPPRTGWIRGDKYMVVMKRGGGGVLGQHGEEVECDAAFYFLRLTERLDTPDHNFAFPGDTAAARAANATKLEGIREDLAPFFDYIDATAGVKRDDVAALWSFTVTTRTELAMDKASQRVPIPLDILKDPSTGHIDLPDAPWDTQAVLDAKARLRELTGFGETMNPMLQFTAPVDPTTVTDKTIEMWQVSGAPGVPVRIPADVALLPDKMSVEVTPTAKPLDEGARFAVVVRTGIKAADGTDVVLMPLGVLLQARDPVFANGKSQVGPVPDDDAARLEKVRPDVVAAEDALTAAGNGNGVLAAWTYTTMPVAQPMADWIAKPDALNVPTAPTVAKHESAGAALADFPLGITSIFNVGDVVTGTVPSPVFLDQQTRGFRADGGYQVQDIAFMATVPKNPKPGPIPVVIFGHGVMTERRFVLAVSDALAAKGFAAIAIDLPMHGTRTYCWTKGPISIPDPTTGKLTNLGPPCNSGSTCNDSGQCVDAQGQVTPFATWPVINMPIASGAAFIEVDEIANTRDHFIQSEVDMSSLLRSLRTADWSAVFGRAVDTSRILYAGESLGGILGATFVANHPEISRAVLNVPGADTVDLFKDSPVFGMQITGFFKREGVDPDSFDGHRFMNVARWFMDAADPQNFGRTLMHPSGGVTRGVLLQMATLDEIIPNTYTKILQAVSGAPRRDYAGEHAFLVVPIEPAYYAGCADMASFLNGEFNQ
jgi:pimeloyl-ACP methyl ester carboxylesterase